jgi:hypothetical protein
LQPSLWWSWSRGRILNRFHQLTERLTTTTTPSSAVLNLNQSSLRSSNQTSCFDRVDERRLGFQDDERPELEERPCESHPLNVDNYRWTTLTDCLFPPFCYLQSTFAARPEELTGHVHVQEGREGRQSCLGRRRRCSCRPASSSQLGQAQAILVDLLAHWCPSTNAASPVSRSASCAQWCT